ncbi:RHEB [Cordylochernes scorpioides]|uniref:RHEB n=1 Tax=Cordylochernes scorpioides TaxID=51811 RepID=A0ABY6KRR7_9ARAC|nr:RHEB [Cordylochernes scorpioides]
MCQSPVWLLSLAGKSSLTIQFVEGRFVDSYEPTIENTFTKTFKVKGQEYSIKLVDTAGQDELSIFPQSYSIDIHGFVLVYSITSSKRGFPPISPQSCSQMFLEEPELCVSRVVSYEEGKKAASLMKAEFLEASAKQNQTVIDIFSTIIWEIEKASGNVQEKSNCSLS